jgi:hypothetical protein
MATGLVPSSGGGTLTQLATQVVTVSNAIRADDLMGIPPVVKSAH